MNLTENPQIKKVVLDLKRLGQYYPNSLRSKRIGEKVRERAISQGQEILINLTMLDLKDEEVTSMVADTSDYMDM
jgi:hypothetical protein